VYIVPFLPAICVGEGVAAALVVSAAADDVMADADDDDAAELDELLDVFDW
jgi:hypothetical protein